MGVVLLFGDRTSESEDSQKPLVVSWEDTKHCATGAEVGDKIIRWMIDPWCVRTGANRPHWGFTRDKKVMYCVQAITTPPEMWYFGVLKFWWRGGYKKCQEETTQVLLRKVGELVGT